MKDFTKTLICIAVFLAALAYVLHSVCIPNDNFKASLLADPSISTIHDGEFSWIEEDSQLNTEQALVGQ